jgi:signal transduction histidine kinase/DNA-binding response OmpR family regulator
MDTLSILVVEDERAHVDAIERAFRSSGVDASMQVAGSLREFREAVDSVLPDIAILDLNLPDGQALEALTSPSENAQFPMLIMTSHGDEQIAVDAMKAGALDYIVKSPESFRDIPRMVDRALREWELIRARETAERELKQSEVRIRAVYDHLPGPTLVWQRRGDDFILTTFNVAASILTGGSIANYVGHPVDDPPPGFPPLKPDIVRCFRDRASIKKEMDYHPPTSDVASRLRITFGFVPPDMVLIHATDVTEQLKTEEQLRVAHRMEAIGRLAGGVAHDFNNMLSVILNYADFALGDIADDSPLRQYLLAIQTAGERAANLTHQLLAFSRKQLVQPRVLGLNDVVNRTVEMLRRLLGEDIELEIALQPGLGVVKADPSQMEQVLMNFVINARDAMPNGGKLIIETANAALDGDYVGRHMAAVRQGEYVLLSVTDTGCGMDKETQARLFEPFFTTKEIGKGTGLGLAMVYGIVKQSNGYVWAYSEPGNGATFKVYLPRVRKESAAMSLLGRAVTQALANETILLVEDEDEVRRIAKHILEKAGYRILSAADGHAALAISEEHSGDIHLLLTDVIMPGMSGKDLSERLMAVYPDLRVLYMSGYTDNAIFHHGVLDPGTHFIGKPFTAAELTCKIREVLDAQPREWTASSLK